MSVPYSALLRRLGLAALAFLVTDLLLAFSVFSVATLGILWAFAVGWIELASEYSANSMTFGTTDQLQQARAILIVAPALMAIVVFLGVRALRIPRRLWRIARSKRPAPLAPVAAVTVVPPPSAPTLPAMTEGALWAARGRPAKEEYHYVSLLLDGSR